jgi:WD40 repeat protein
LIAVGTYYDVLIIDLEIGKPILTLPIKLARIIDIAFTSNNQGLAILYSKTIYGDSTFFSIYDIATGNNSIAFKFDDTYSSSFSLNSANTKIAVSYGSMVKVYNLSGKELFMFNDFNEAVTTVSFADNDTKIIAACEKTTNVYDIQNMQLIKRYTPHNLGFCIQTISNEYILSAGGTKKKGAMTLWNYNTGKTISNTFKGIDQVVAECDISPDKSTIVAALGFWHGYIGYEKPMEVKVWDGKTGGIKGILQHQDKCKGVFFSANGELIYTVTYSGSIIFWETKSLKKICTIENLSNNRWVAYTPDGYFDGNQSGIATLHFVKGLDVLPLESLYEQYYSPKHILQVLSGEKIKRPSINISQINMPPIVEITNLAKNSIVTNPALQITIKATDQGGGIDEIRLYHNGKLLDGTSRGFRSVGQTHEFTVTLTDGENRIKATAFNSQRTESIPDEIVVNYKAPQQVKPNMHILAVGINTYLNPKYNLNYAKNDADAFVKSLSTGASSLFGKVEVTSINDANATKTGIVAAFDRIKATAKAEDVFVFYYAGHGVMSTGNDTEKPLFYLIPHDVTKMYEADDMLKRLGISANEIGEFSKNIKAQKQLFVIDACQSGGAMQTLASRGASEEKAIAQLARSTGTYFIAASGTEQFATEVAELGHGVFTYAVIEALKGSCKSQDGRVTVNLLKSCVEDLVPELSKKHKGQPQFPTGYGFGMDFPIVIVK